MNTYEKLQAIIKETKAGLSIEINEHKNYYESVSEFLKDRESDEGIVEHHGQEVLDKMIELDTIVNLHFYKNTPVGFIPVYHYDLDEAINIMYDWYFN